MVGHRLSWRLAVSRSRHPSAVDPGRHGAEPEVWPVTGTQNARETETHRCRRFQLSQSEARRSTLQTVVKLPHDSRAANELSLQERSKQALYQRPVPAAKIAIGAPCA